MKKVLITGSSGFVGSNLHDAFDGNFDLYGLDITTTGRFPAKHTYSWNNLGALPEFDAIIHLAGKAHDTADSTKEEEYFRINLGLTQQVFDHFLKSAAQTFIFFSTVKAVADSVPAGGLTEETPPDPQTPYGRSKLAAERYIQEQLSEQGGSKKQVYILRPCMIHGPGNKGNLNLLYKFVKKGVPWPLGAFRNKRSFLSFENLVFVIKRLIDGNVAPGIYHVADDEAVSTNELIELMAWSMNRRGRIWNVPVGFMRNLARAGDLLNLPLNSERLKKLTESYLVSNDHLKNALGVDKMPVSATEGLRHTLKHFANS